MCDVELRERTDEFGFGVGIQILFRERRFVESQFSFVTDLLLTLLRVSYSFVWSYSTYDMRTFFECTIQFHNIFAFCFSLRFVVFLACRITRIYHFARFLIYSALNCVVWLRIDISGLVQFTVAWRTNIFLFLGCIIFWMDFQLINMESKVLSRWMLFLSRNVTY